MVLFENGRRNFLKELFAYTETGRARGGDYRYNYDKLEYEAAWHGGDLYDKLTSGYMDKYEVMTILGPQVICKILGDPYIRFINPESILCQCCPMCGR